MGLDVIDPVARSLRDGFYEDSVVKRDGINLMPSIDTEVRAKLEIERTIKQDRFWRLQAHMDPSEAPFVIKLGRLGHTR
jgi:hypothetical protein